LFFPLFFSIKNPCQFYKIIAQSPHSPEFRGKVC